MLYRMESHSLDCSLAGQKLEQILAMQARLTDGLLGFPSRWSSPRIREVTSRLRKPTRTNHRPWQKSPGPPVLAGAVSANVYLRKIAMRKGDRRNAVWSPLGGSRIGGLTHVKGLPIV